MLAIVLRCRFLRLTYDNNGLALVLLGGVLVGSVGDDLGDGDRLRSVSGTVLQASCGRSSYGTVGLRHHEASQNGLVEVGIGTACPLLAQTTCAFSVGVLTSQELVQAHQQPDVGVGGLRDLCILVNLSSLEGFMLRLKDSCRQRITAPTRRGITYCGARLEHGGGRGRFPS
jgi:hypothetical protein